MAVYRTQFERINFDFDPPLKQVSDVVFETDIPFDDDHLADFEVVAWDAMWAQNPGWNDYSSPLEGYSGWSSVLGGRKYEEVKDEGLDFNLGVPGEGTPRIAETFYRKDDPTRSYRVTSFYKTYVPKPRKDKTAGDQMASDIITKILAEEDAKLSDKERAWKAREVKIVSCTRDEAEYIGGAGVAGCIARLEDVVITGRVSWEDRTIARYRRDYRVHDDFPTTIHKYWED